jgi:hypothetical protein
MAFRPENYGDIARYAAWILSFENVNVFKGVVFKVNNNRPSSPARRCLLLLF